MPRIASIAARTISRCAGWAEIRLDGRRKVMLSGLPDDRPETAVAALREALKLMQGRAREAARSEAEAEEKAA